jgi:hypothetical protein
MKKERLTGTLKLRNNRPPNHYLAGLGFDEGTFATILPFANDLETAARIWVVKGGFVERGPITKRDAENMWLTHLAKASAE